MTNVLLGQSYYLRFDPKLWEAMQPYPPLGALYAASLLRQEGYTVALFDAMLAESEAEWEAALDQHQPRFAVLFEDNFNYLSKMCLLRMRQATLRMMGMAKARGCTVIVAGADATDHYDLYLAHGADFALLGEGEGTLVELLHALTGRQPRELREIAGLAWRDVAGQTVRNGPRPLLRALDALPFPAWGLVDLPRYRQVWQARHGYFSMNMATTRGCPYHCNWCAKPIWGQRYTVRSPQNVAAEMKWLKTAFAPDHIWFVDDIFGLKPGWIEQFGQAVQAADAAIPFKCLLRVDLVKDSVVAGLRQAGCQTVWVGAESGSQKILDAMDKGTTVEQIYEAAAKLHGAGIEVGFFLQFGYPGEDRADIEATLRMVRDCQPDDIGMSVSYPLPGTKFYDHVRLQLGGKQNWQDSADLAMLYRGPYSTAFYRQLHTVLHKEFRARRAWRELTGRGRQRKDGQGESWGARRPQPGLVRQAATVAYHVATLPWARVKLARLERQSDGSSAPLPALLTPDAAATPSAQPE
ncbi:MAG: B12-binding domain-containing radical SAM protein [Anaerolineae bacterium]|nr:B12-binding domain-containing radical SAM protein [Anaerolineae bacterium]